MNTNKIYMITTTKEKKRIASKQLNKNFLQNYYNITKTFIRYYSG